MAHKQFTEEDIIWIEKYFLADVKVLRIFEITRKKLLVYDFVNCLKDGRDSKKFRKT